MARNLIIEEVSESGRKVLGEIEPGREIGVGREPDEGGIALDMSSVSRVHGVFFSREDHWFYKDNNSTNGSWVNGKQVGGGEIKLIRAGDVLQLADVALQVRDGSRASVPGRYGDTVGVHGRSVLAFRSNEYIQEYLIPEYGKAVVVGGSSCDLEVDGDLRDAPSLVIERRKTAVVVYSVAKSLPVTVNGSEIEGTYELHDGDEIRLQEYFFIFQDPSELKQRAGAAASAGQQLFGVDEAPNEDGPTEEVPDFDIKPKKRAVNANFGRQARDVSEDEEEEIFGGQQQTVSGERAFRSSMIFPPGDSVEDVSYASLESKIILVVVFVLLMVLVMLAAFFVLSS